MYKLTTFEYIGFTPDNYGCTASTMAKITSNTGGLQSGPLDQPYPQSLATSVTCSCGEPTQISMKVTNPSSSLYGNTYSSIQFSNNNYQTDNDGSRSTCSPQGDVTIQTTTQSILSISGGVTVSYGGYSASGSFTIQTGQSSAYTYTFYAPYGGQWDIDALTGSGLLAFQWYTC